jgi:putative phage-type endonuclease
MKPTKFQRDRASGIGGSDAPVLCGVARWRTPFQLWVEKTRAMAGEFEKDDEDNPLLLWGTLMEPQILKQFGKQTDRLITRPKDMIRHPEIDWLIAHLDGLQVHWFEKGRGEGVVEAKNVSRYVSDRWVDEVPVEVQVQAQHCMAASGLEYATAVGLVGGHQLIWKDIERNQKFIDALLEKEDEFWIRVLADNPPTATAADHKFLNTLVKPVEKKIIIFDGVGGDLDVELQVVLNEIEKQKGVLDPLTEERERIEAEIKQMIGDAEEAHTPSGQVYTFKEVVTNEYVRKESRYRRLVRKK